MDKRLTEMTLAKEVVDAMYKNSLFGRGHHVLLCTPDFAMELGNELKWLDPSQSKFTSGHNLAVFQGLERFNKLTEFYGMKVIRTLDIKRFEILTSPNERII